jgi:hypothetical protein
MNSSRIIFLVALAVMMIFSNPGISREEQPIDILTVPGTIINCDFIDLDNDRLREALVFYEDESSGELTRRMAIFAINKNRFERHSRQTIDIDPSAACFDIADIDNDGDQDLLLMASDGVTAHIYQSGSFGLAPFRIIRDTTIFGTNSVENLVRWEFLRPLDSLSKNNILFIPTLTGFNIYQDNRGKYEFKQSIHQGHISIVGGRAAYDNIKAIGFRIGCTLPALIIADYNGDKQPDIFICDNRVVGVHKRNFDGKFEQEPTEIFGKNLLTSDERRLGKTAIGFDIHDLNRDGVADIVVTKNAGDVTNYQTSVQLYKGKPIGGYNSTPSEQFSVANGASNPYVYDLNQDGRLDLIIPSLKLGFMSTLKILLLKSVEVNLTVYLQNPADEFAQKPDYEKEFSYDVDINQNIDYAGILTLDGDYNGDNRNDLLIHEGDGVIKIYANSISGVFESGVYREIRIPRPDGLNSMDLNGDGKDEIIAHYLYQRQNRNSVRIIW